MKNKYTLALALWLCGNLVLWGQNINSAFMHNGVNRTYIVHLPPTYTPNSQMPLVLVLHGLGDSGNGIMLGTGFNTAADTAGFIAVYPNAADALFGAAAWNSGANPFGSADDVGFLSALIDTMHQQYHINLNRVYSTGFSMGGIMSHRLACTLSERLAAIASGSGTFATSVIGTCSPTRAVPVMHVHGTADTTVPYDGNALLGLSSVAATVDFWVSHNACFLTAPASTPIPNTANDGITINRVDYNLCTGSSEVILYTATGMTHTWLQPNNDMSETAEIWKFFSKHQLSEPSVGIDLPNTPPALSCYPNPTTNQLTVQLNLQDAQQLRLVNMLGQTLYQQPLSSGSQSLQINVVHLSKGLYLLQVQTPKGWQSVKVSKQ